MLKENYKIFLLTILIAAIGGGVSAFCKIVLEVMPPFTFLFFRFLAALVILLPLFIKNREKADKKSYLVIIIISLLGTGNVVFVTLGLKSTSAIAAQVLYSGVPLIAFIASAIILKSTVSLRQFLGILIGLIGVLIIIITPGLASGNLSNSTGTIFGNILVFTAVISYSLYTVFTKKVQHVFSPLTLTTVMVIATLILQPAFMTFESINSAEIMKNMTLLTVIGILYVGMLGTSVYILLYQVIIKSASPVIASMTLYLQPVFSFIWAYLLLGEKLTFSLLIGSCLGFLGAGLVMKKQNCK